MRFPILSYRGSAAKSVLSLYAQLQTSPSFSVTSVSVGVFKSQKHLPKPTKKKMECGMPSASVLTCAM